MQENLGQSPNSLLPYLGFLLVSCLAIVVGIIFGLVSMAGEAEERHAAAARAAHDASRVQEKGLETTSSQRGPQQRIPKGDAPARDTSMDKTEQGDGQRGASQIATFGAGCFWCVEAVLERVDGVHDVVSGYMGGHVDNPHYADVCTGQTGHAEVVQVHFDPAVVSFETLVEWFWKLHDPTTLNRQGADTGTQYRSAIFYHDAEQKRVAIASRDAHAKDFANEIVTEITEAVTFWRAEVDHQDYYRLNPNAGYCQAVIAPKLRKLEVRDR